jgi:hypothetical protein
MWDAVTDVATCARIYRATYSSAYPRCTPHRWISRLAREGARTSTSTTLMLARGGRHRAARADQRWLIWSRAGAGPEDVHLYASRRRARLGEDGALGTVPRAPARVDRPTGTLMIDWRSGVCWVEGAEPPRVWNLSSAGRRRGSHMKKALIARAGAVWRWLRPCPGTSGTRRWEHERMGREGEYGRTRPTPFRS